MGWAQGRWSSWPAWTIFNQYMKDLHSLNHQFVEKKSDPIHTNDLWEGVKKNGLIWDFVPNYG